MILYDFILYNLILYNNIGNIDKIWQNQLFQNVEIHEKQCECLLRKMAESQ